MNLSSEISTLIKMISHINQVSSELRRLSRRLDERADLHDISKFRVDEFTGFCQLDINRGQQREEYGSESYEEGVKFDAVKLHHSRNPHHPEYWPNGIKDMNLVDIIEMLCDWEAARWARDSERDIDKIWLTRQRRFNLTDQELSFLRTLWEKIEGE